MAVVYGERYSVEDMVGLFYTHSSKLLQYTFLIPLIGWI